MFLFERTLGWFAILGTLHLPAALGAHCILFQASRYRIQSFLEKLLGCFSRRAFVYIPNSSEADAGQGDVCAWKFEPELWSCMIMASCPALDDLHAGMVR